MVPPVTVESSSSESKPTSCVFIFSSCFTLERDNLPPEIAGSHDVALDHRELHHASKQATPNYAHDQMHPLPRRLVGLRDPSWEAVGRAQSLWLWRRRRAVPLVQSI